MILLQYDHVPGVPYCFLIRVDPGRRRMSSSPGPTSSSAVGHAGRLHAARQATAWTLLEELLSSKWGVS